LTGYKHNRDTTPFTLFTCSHGLRKKEVILDLNTKVKLTEANKKDKLTVKEIVAMFNTRKNQMCDTLEANNTVYNVYIHTYTCSQKHNN
jgi:hypothetical protein